ncbi:MAG: energy-coupling factor ABC transporter ATP-binding protein [Bacillota bacterium]
MKIRIDHLKKTYGSKNVVNIQGLEIEKGILLGIIGPNGAGKSTLIQLLGGLEEPTCGEIYYDGEKINEKKVKDITVVFQKPYLLRTTVFKNIAYPLIIRGYEKDIIEKMVSRMLEEMELVELKDRKAWTLSGGEAQKIALARALIYKPSLLLLDEPTANIDPSSMNLMERMIRKGNEEDGMTVIMVTHHIPQAKRLCSDLLFMNNGFVIEQGKTRDMIYHPENPLTRCFINEEVLIGYGEDTK